MSGQTDKALGYPAHWHVQFGEKTLHSARVVLQRVFDLVPVRTVAEVGCGNAHWTKAALELGIEDYILFDGPWNEVEDLLVDRARLVIGDLNRPFDVDRRYDLAICVEVAEHLEPASSVGLVKSLCAAADVVIFGAAVPGSGGFGHINEHWQSWWADQFKREGYSAFDIIRPHIWNDASVHYWYRQNTILYVSDAARDIQDRLKKASSGAPANSMMDLVHPEKFTEAVEFDHISFRLLLKKLPGLVRARLRHRLSSR